MGAGAGMIGRKERLVARDKAGISSESKRALEGVWFSALVRGS